MPEKENYTSQDSDSRFLYKGKFLNDKFYRKNHWSLLRCKQLLKDFKLPKKINNAHKAECKSLCLFTGVLTLLSIGMCIQADSIVQALQEVGRISVQQIMRMK